MVITRYFNTKGNLIIQPQDSPQTIPSKGSRFLLSLEHTITHYFVQDVTYIIEADSFSGPFRTVVDITLEKF